MSDWRPTTFEQMAKEILAVLDSIAPYWQDDFGREEALEWIEARWLEIRRKPLTREAWAHRCLASLEKGAEALFA
ncbi:MAG: hypothetical protein H6719_06205 [Sandaracinaceae bacterium]|nr:hypothetical protein [Sandaracinaceae bacterium]